MAPPPSRSAGAMEAREVIGRLLGPALLLLVSVLCWPATAPADQPMTFRLVRASPWSVDIYAAGEITHDTPAQFAAFLQENNIKAPATVFLFSGGGDLDAGLALGREIRRAGLDTEVGVPQGSIAGPAECDSSCTFAFLGGVTRTMAPGSRYGVHRFSGNVANPLQTAQEEAGKLVAYIAEMGVSRGMYTEMTEGTPAQVKYLDAGTMAKLRITTTVSVRGKMAFDAGYPVLVVQDLQGLVQYGRIDFFCRTGQLIARGYFSWPGGVVDATSSAVAWMLFMPGAHRRSMWPFRRRRCSSRPPRASR